MSFSLTHWYIVAEHGMTNPKNGVADLLSRKMTILPDVPASLAAGRGETVKASHRRAPTPGGRHVPVGEKALSLAEQRCSID
jgi:hypothetical protein